MYYKSNFFSQYSNEYTPEAVFLVSLTEVRDTGTTSIVIFTILVLPVL
jgi:hypothetical protein